MNKSESIGALAKALAGAQKEMRNPAFDSTNPHFKSKFASLGAVREVVIPTLNKHGLSLSQWPTAADGCAGCVNLLTHESGEWIEQTLLLPLDKQTAHGAGSAVTYARRYSMQAIAGVVADEDDDGNASIEKPAKHQANAPLTAEEKAIKETIEGCASLDALAAVWKPLSYESRQKFETLKDSMKEKILAADRAAITA